MTVIKSSSSQQSYDFVIDGLTNEIENLNDLVEVYKVALEDEGNKIIAIRQHVRNEVKAALLDLQMNKPGNTLARLAILLNQI